MKKPTCLILTGIGVLLLIVVLIFAVPFFMNVFEKAGELTEKHAEYKRALTQTANEPLTVEQEELLAGLLKIAEETTQSQDDAGIEGVLSHISYLEYLKSYDNEYVENYSTYLAAMPTTKHKTIAKSRLVYFLDSDTDQQDVDTWVNYYYILRDWSKTGKSPATDQKEFQELMQTHLVNPLMANAEVAGLTSKIMEMGILSTFIVEDNEVFHHAWRKRVLSSGNQEGYLRNAIASPVEFALMRSFFVDAATFEKWLSKPFHQKEEPADVEQQQ